MTAKQRSDFRVIPMLAQEPTFRRRVDGKKELQEGKKKRGGDKECHKKWSIKRKGWIIWESWQESAEKQE